MENRTGNITNASMLTDENINITDRALLKTTQRGVGLELARKSDVFQQVSDAEEIAGLGPSGPNLPASGNFGAVESSGSEGVSREILESEANLDSDKRESMNRENIHGGSDSEVARQFDDHENVRDSVVGPPLASNSYQSKSLLQARLQQEASASQFSDQSN